jgi:iron complex outermembrane receptor protein
MGRDSKVRSQKLYSYRTNQTTSRIVSEIRSLHDAQGAGHAFRSTLLSSAVAIAATLFSGAALAQDAAAGAAAVPTNQVEDIVVTAQHRNERLQDVPVAVTSLSAAALNQQGVTSTSDLAQATPSLIFNSQVAVANPYIRGVGSDLFDPTSESAVAIYVDDVYMAAPAANVFTLKGIKQIDVLNGPQGTLFGRNATGGVIQIRTLDPSATPKLDFGVTIANYRDVTASLYASTGIGDAVSTSLSVLYEDQGDGYGKNLATKADVNKYAIGNISVRNKWKIDLSKGTQVYLIGDYSNLKNTVTYTRPEGSFSTLPGATQPTGFPGKFNANIDQPDFLNVESGGVSMKVDHDFGTVSLTSISAYRKLRTSYGLDQDQTVLPVIDILWNTKFKNFSQELRLAGKSASSFKWIVGAFYYNAKGSYNDFSVDKTVFIPFDQQKTESLAGFAQATVELVSGLRLTGGARYTWEKQTFIFPAAFSTGSQTVREPTFRGALDYKFTHDILGYVSFNTGFKSGGYNLLSGSSFKPEKLKSYEAGIKSELFGRILRLNVDGFYYDYTNQQVNISQFGGNTVANAAGSHIQGLEANMDFVPTSRLKFSGGMSIMDGHYTNYFDYQPRDAEGNNIGGPINAKGATTARTPKFVGNVSAQYTMPTRIGEFAANVGVQYNDGYYWVADSRLRQPSYTIVNAGLSYRPGGGPAEIRVWGKNLLDSTYYSIQAPGANPVGDNSVNAPPRTYGVTLSYRYN